VNTRLKKSKEIKIKNYNELTIEDKLTCISLYPEEAKSDEAWHVRLAAYRILGFTEEAKLDEAWNVRLEAYRVLGFTEEAKSDKYWKIRREAEIFFIIKRSSNNS